MSFAAFLKKISAASKLAILNQLEYRANLFFETVLQPLVTVLVEALLWIAIFKYTKANNFGGFNLSSYLQYVLWATFFARISISWMYEYKMVNDVETGAVNTMLLRPLSFFSFYWGQILGYKALSTVVSLLIPLSLALLSPHSFHFDRLPQILLMLLVYLFFIHCTSFILASLGFFWNKVYSFTVAKNLLIVFFSGELYPLDLLPSHLKDIALMLPFPCGVFIPAAYLTGRIDHLQFVKSFLSLCLFIAVLYAVSQVFWRRGLRNYSGTGA